MTMFAAASLTSKLRRWYLAALLLAPTACVLARPGAALELASASGPASAAAQFADKAAAKVDIPPEQRISTAETLLFQTAHLSNLAPAAVLLYSFHRQGSLEPGFDDEVRLMRAGKRTSVRFLSGQRQHPVPEVEQAEDGEGGSEAQGNPVLLAFLEHDIADMHRLTGGSSSYFRKRIRLALAGSAQVSTRRFVYLGKRVDGREVDIEPYRNDPMHARFEQYVGKRYSFILSAGVPGGIYQIRTVVPGLPGRSKHAPPSERSASVGQGALADETLTLIGFEQAPR